MRVFWILLGVAVALLILVRRMYVSIWTTSNTVNYAGKFPKSVKLTDMFSSDEDSSFVKGKLILK